MQLLRRALAERNEQVVQVRSWIESTALEFRFRLFDAALERDIAGIREHSSLNEICTRNCCTRENHAMT